MTVGRIMKQKFGEWSATVKAVHADGTEVVCTATGQIQVQDPCCRNLNLGDGRTALKCQLPVGTPISRRGLDHQA